MSRLSFIAPIIPAMISAVPAAAHSADHAHLHETDGLTLLLGLSLIGLGAGAAAYVKVRRK